MKSSVGYHTEVIFTMLRQKSKIRHWLKQGAGHQHRKDIGNLGFLINVMGHKGEFVKAWNSRKLSMRQDKQLFVSICLQAFMTMREGLNWEEGLWNMYESFSLSEWVFARKISNFLDMAVFVWKLKWWRSSI